MAAVSTLLYACRFVCCVYNEFTNPCPFFTRNHRRVRKQNTYAMEWGMWAYEDVEQPRPAFLEHKTIKVRVNAVHGTPERFFPWYKRIVRQSESFMIMVVLGCCVIACIVGVVVMRLTLTTIDINENSDWLSIQMKKHAATIAGLVNYVQIVVMGLVWGKVARKLNDFENHRTATQYEDSLILKTFLFQFFNNYSSFTYIALFQNFVSFHGSQKGCYYPGGCLGLLEKSLLTVFATKLIVSNFFEIKGVLWDKCVSDNIKNGLSACVNAILRRKTKDTALIEKNMLEAEKQMDLGVYDVYSSIADYLELVMQFGYVTLFVVACPLAPFLAFISDYVESRIDALKLIEGARRPQPDGARDIGTWEDILKFMGYLAVGTNAFIIIFDGNFGYIRADMPMAEKWVGFLILEHLMFAIKLTVGWLLPDVPHDVTLQLARQEFIVSKVILNVPDEEQDDHATVGKGRLAEANANKMFRGDDVYENWDAFLKTGQAAATD